MKKLTKKKIEERITNLNTLDLIPADEVQLNLDVVYNSVLDEVCSVVPMDSPRQVISALKLVYDSEQKVVNDDNKDIINTALMSTVGAMPLDDAGYPTDVVKFEAQSSNFIGNFKNILPGTVVLGEDGLYKDDFNGNIVDTNDSIVGTVDYNKALFSLNNSIETPILVTYKFDIYNLETSRNFAKFVKSSVEMFADLYQLDADTAVVLNDFKGVKLKDNIKNILPQVLAQQIDQNILLKYFDLLELPSTKVSTWSANSNVASSANPILTLLYRDFGTYVGIKMGAFTARTGVIPNVILCDSLAFNILRVSRGFKYADEKNLKCNGTPKVVGTFSTAKVIVVQDNNIKPDETDLQKGKLVITYKGDSDAQAAGVYAPFIPVTLRSVTGMEGQGMIETNNIYSIGGFTFTNPQLVEGIKIEDIDIE